MSPSAPFRYNTIIIGLAFSLLIVVAWSASVIQPSDYDRRKDHYDKISVKASVGSFSEAEQIWRDEIKSKTPVQDIFYADAEAQLADILCQRAVQDHAAFTPEPESLYLDAIRIRRKVLGANYNTRSNFAIQLKLAKLYRLQGEYDKAESLCKEVLALRNKQFGKDSYKSMEALFEL